MPLDKRRTFGVHPKLDERAAVDSFFVNVITYRQCKYVRVPYVIDESVELNGITFVWSKAKARKNFEKHSVTFEQAAEAFFDPFLRLVDVRSEEDV